MQRFMPFEDDWDALEHMHPDDLVPFRRGMLDGSPHVTQSTSPTSPSMTSSSPGCAPMRRAVPAASSNT